MCPLKKGYLDPSSGGPPEPQVSQMVGTDIILCAALGAVLDVMAAAHKV